MCLQFLASLQEFVETFSGTHWPLRTLAACSKFRECKIELYNNYGIDQNNCLLNTNKPCRVEGSYCVHVIQ